MLLLPAGALLWKDEGGNLPSDSVSRWEGGSESSQFVGDLGSAGRRGGEELSAGDPLGVGELGEPAPHGPQQGGV